MKRSLVFSLIFGGLFRSTCALGTPQDWKTADECTEYLPKALCHVTIPLSDVSNGTNPAPTHPDVTIRPAGVAGVILKNASPLMVCTLAGSPAPLSRDVSASVTTFLSTLATFGLPGSNPILQAGQLDLRTLPGTSGSDARKIDNELTIAANAVNKDDASYEQALDDYREAKDSVKRNWKYSYKDDASFAAAATNMYQALVKAFEDPLPGGDDWKALNQSAESASKDLDTFKAKYTDANGQLNPPDCNGVKSCADDFQSWYRSAQSRLRELKSRLTLLPAQVQFLNDMQGALKPGFTWLNSNSAPAGSGTFDAAHSWTTIYLPMSSYAQKQVTEAITCKDVATQAQAFDAITFTAYYEPAASWDLSAAAFISLVPGRQVGVISGPQSAGSTILAVTSHSSVQFIPGAVFEVHPSHYLNFRCPWAEDGTGYHPWGYVCSVGLAGGFLINPNNGSTQAEVFEGISFGIHRLAILIGNHTGRFQEFGEGYQVGQVVPSGTSPPTLRRWTNHPAIGIAYRIPIR